MLDKILTSPHRHWKVSTTDNIEYKKEYFSYMCCKVNNSSTTYYIQLKKAQRVSFLKKHVGDYAFKHISKEESDILVENFESSKSFKEYGKSANPGRRYLEEHAIKLLEDEDLNALVMGQVSYDENDLSMLPNQNQSFFMKAHCLRVSSDTFSFVLNRSCDFVQFLQTYIVIDGWKEMYSPVKKIVVSCGKEEGNVTILQELEGFSHDQSLRNVCHVEE